MEGENMNNNGNINVNVNDGDIRFAWENALSNSNCPTLSSDQAQKAAAVVAEVGEGSAKATEKRRRVRKGKKPVAARGGEAAADPDHELHIWTERERRKKMRCKFSELLALLPHAPAKADKSTIVEEAVSFIKIVEQKLQNLQRQKLERYQCQTPTSVGSSCNREAFIADQGSSAPHGSGQENYQILTAGNPLSGTARYATTFKTLTTPNMVLNLCGDRVQINICCPKRSGIFGVICFYLEKYKLQVLYATVSCDQYRAMFMIQAHASGGVDQLSEAALLSVEDLFQLAMGDIMVHISTMM